MPLQQTVSAGEQNRALGLSTFAFTICFAVWTIFAIIGIQIKQDLGLNDTQFGLLVGTPILTGSLVRLMLGIWTDQYGGRLLFPLTMVASAWLKRWGLPVVIIGFALLGVTLEKLYAITLVGDTLEAIARNAGLAFMAGSSKHGDFSIKPGDDIDAVLAGAPQWAWADAGAALQAAASPLFMGGLVLAAACFALLVLRRQRA